MNKRSTVAVFPVSLYSLRSFIGIGNGVSRVAFSSTNGEPLGLAQAIKALSISTDYNVVLYAP
jgi:hypothetical protein